MDDLFSAANLHGIIGNLIPFSFDAMELSTVMNASRTEICLAIQDIFTTVKLKSQLKKMKVLAKRYSFSDLKSNVDFWYMEACMILLIDSLPSSMAMKISREDFLVYFPEFRDLDIEEITKLLNFRNLLIVAFQLISPLHNRGHLIAVLTRILEGKEVHYISGSGMTKSTKYRIHIYNTVGNIVPKEKQVRALTLGARSLLRGSNEDDTEDEGDAGENCIDINAAELPLRRSAVDTGESSANKKARQATYSDLPLDSIVTFESIKNVLFPFSFDLDDDTADLLQKFRLGFSELEEVTKRYSTPKETSRAIAKFATNTRINPVSRFNDQFLVIEAFAILIVYCRPTKAQERVDLQTLLNEFPDFASVDAAEQENLLKYRNLMASALEVIPAANNSGHLLDILTRIVEGKYVKHIPGSGMTQATKNRINIYNTVGGITQLYRIIRPDYSSLGTSLGAAETLALMAESSKESKRAPVGSNSAHIFSLLKSERVTDQAKEGGIVIKVNAEDVNMNI